MAVEIEAKMKVPDFSAIREKLVSLGAPQVAEVMETNVFFDTEDRSLLAKDQGLRLRSAQPIAGGPAMVNITFKGPRQHGPLKSREEKELGVEDAKDAIALLEILGYRRVLSFEKKRQSWTVADCEVELDEVPHIGMFVEIEGPSDASIMAVRETLQLGNRPLIKASYVALLMTYLQEKNQPKRVVKFE